MDINFTLAKNFIIETSDGSLPEHNWVAVKDFLMFSMAVEYFNNSSDILYEKAQKDGSVHDLRILAVLRSGDHIVLQECYISDYNDF